MNPAGLSTTAAPDPLQFALDLPLRNTYHPHGFPVTVITNSREVLEAAEESWNDHTQRFGEPPIEVRVAVEEGGHRTGVPEPPVFRGQGHLVTVVSDAANFAVCDRDKRCAALWLSSRAVRERDWLRFHFLDAVVYVALAQLYLTPLHAACVARGGRGVLLCGGPGAGKSSLAYACARGGWTYVADDASSLVRGREDRQVLGRPDQIRFRENAVELFPELAGRLVRRRPNGKMTIEVRTAELARVRTAHECRADYVVFLKRPCPGASELRRVSRGRALARLLEDMPSLGDTVREEHEASVRGLVEAPAFELAYSSLDAAVDCLTDLVERS